MDPRVIDFLSNVSWSSAASIVFGAAISALVSYVLQKNSFAEAKRQKESDRLETRRTLAYSLLFKMIRINSTIVSLDKTLNESFARATESKFEGEAWQIVLPIGNLPDRIKFSAEEMALLLSLDNHLFNDVGPYDDVHNSLLDIFALYRTRRETMMAKFGAEMDGALGTTTLAKADALWVAPRAFELNGLVEEMVQRTNYTSKESRQLLKRTQSLFAAKFDPKLRLEFKET